MLLVLCSHLRLGMAIFLSGRTSQHSFTIIQNRVHCSCWNFCQFKGKIRRGHCAEWKCLSAVDWNGTAGQNPRRHQWQWKKPVRDTIRQYRDSSCFKDENGFRQRSLTERQTERQNIGYRSSPTVEASRLYRGLLEFQAVQLTSLFRCTNWGQISCDNCRVIR